MQAPFEPVLLRPASAGTCRRRPFAIPVASFLSESSVRRLAGPDGA